MSKVLRVENAGVSVQEILFIVEQCLNHCHSKRE